MYNIIRDEDGNKDFDDNDDNEDEDYDVDDSHGDESLDMSVEDYIKHDCNNIKVFDPNNPRNLSPDYVGKNIPTFRDVDKITQYNHAYGIPVFGQAHITPGTMKRACFLIR